MTDETYTYTFEIHAVRYEIGRGLVLTTRITAPEPQEQLLDMTLNHITASFEDEMVRRGIDLDALEARGVWTDDEEYIIGGMVWDYAQKLTGEA